MDPIYDLASIRKTLRDGITKGYWTEEHFDTPSLGRRMLEEDMKHHKVMELRSFQLPTHRNLLRDDYHPEAVQASPDPRDFAEPGSDLRSDHAPLPVEGNSGSVFSDGRDQLGHEPGSRSSDSEGQAELGTEGEQAARGSGMPLDW